MNLQKQEYFVISAIEKENIASDKNFTSLCAVLNQIAEQYGYPIIVTTHPRTRKMIDQKKIAFNSLVKLEKPFALSDYLSLQMNAKAVLSDSGTISEESSILGFPALNIREAQKTGGYGEACNDDRIKPGKDYSGSGTIRQRSNYK